MTDVIKCPDCGGLVSIRFPMHECKVPLSKLRNVAATDGMSRIHLSGAPHRGKKKKCRKKSNSD
jgi:hypothetical protein